MGERKRWKRRENWGGRSGKGGMKKCRRVGVRWRSRWGWRSERGEVKIRVLKVGGGWFGRRGGREEEGEGKGKRGKEG